MFSCSSEQTNGGRVDGCHQFYMECLMDTLWNSSLIDRIVGEQLHPQQCTVAMQMWRVQECSYITVKTLQAHMHARWSHVVWSHMLYFLPMISLTNLLVLIQVVWMCIKGKSIIPFEWMRWRGQLDFPYFIYYAKLGHSRSKDITCIEGPENFWPKGPVKAIRSDAVSSIMYYFLLPIHSYCFRNVPFLFLNN